MSERFVILSETLCDSDPELVEGKESRIDPSLRLG
jgi:hypothetical protein